jgi:hypothetical protein
MKKIKECLKKFKNEIILFLLVLYILVLGFGVVGEVFNKKWILDIPIFRI